MITETISCDSGSHGGAEGECHDGSPLQQHTVGTHPWLPRRRTGSRGAPFLGALALAVAVAFPAFAADNSISNLGPLTSATPQYAPLGGFRHARGSLPRSGPARVFFIGTQFDSFSAAARWPLVKALDQFGAWSHLSSSSANALVHTSVSVGDIPTFDFVHATYRSKYVRFVHKDTADRNGRPLQRPTTSENALFRRYLGNPAYGSSEFTMVAIGDYVMMDSGYAPGDLQNLGGNPYPFDTVRGDLRTDHQQHYVAFVSEINAEANVMTALICHADHMRPGSVCRRNVVKRILRHVR